MEIIVGKTAGPCFGVKRAIIEAKKTLKKFSKTYCLGELVHNKQINEELKKQGIIYINNIEDAKERVIIRAHGEPESTYKKAKQRKIEIVDLTCPKVLRIHEIVKEYTKRGYYVFLTGQNNHPETIGIVGFCDNNYAILEEIKDIEKSIEKFRKSEFKKAILISQTTYSLEKFNNIEKELKEKIGIKKIEVIKTICEATKLRQEETEKISKEVDAMIIIGGKNSSNTNKLYQIATKNCKQAFFIETETQLDIEKIKKCKKIGIMAGASTPNESIEKTIEILKKV